MHTRFESLLSMKSLRCFIVLAALMVCTRPSPVRIEEIEEEPNDIMSAIQKLENIPMKSTKENVWHGNKQLVSSLGVSSNPGSSHVQKPTSRSTVVPYYAVHRPVEQYTRKTSTDVSPRDSLAAFDRSREPQTVLNFENQGNEALHSTHDYEAEESNSIYQMRPDYHLDTTFDQHNAENSFISEWFILVDYNDCSLFMGGVLLTVVALLIFKKVRSIRSNLVPTNHVQNGIQLNQFPSNVVSRNLDFGLDTLDCELFSF